MALAVPRHVESSWTRDQTCVPCVGRQILIHSATKEVLRVLDNKKVHLQVHSKPYVLCPHHSGGSDAFKCLTNLVIVQNI